MQYELLTDLIGMVKIYEVEKLGQAEDLGQFASWLNERLNEGRTNRTTEPDWLGKSNGRSAESVINTSLVHLYRYAKMHAKAAIAGTLFSTPDDFIYLISLTSHGSISKSALIKLNVHEKSVGMQIINRLINNGLVIQEAVENDKRNRMITITQAGKELLASTILNIKSASRTVTEPLSHQEKMDLIRLLLKLENFHEEKAKSH